MLGSLILLTKPFVPSETLFDIEWKVCPIGGKERLKSLSLKRMRCRWLDLSSMKLLLQCRGKTSLRFDVLWQMTFSRRDTCCSGLSAKNRVVCEFPYISHCFRCTNQCGNRSVRTLQTVIAPNKETRQMWEKSFQWKHYPVILPTCKITRPKFSPPLHTWARTLAHAGTSAAICDERFRKCHVYECGWMNSVFHFFYFSPAPKFRV